jgi:site-specific DNA recombinase
MPEDTVKKVRCVVYTRKSTEEGLDQEFNSLQAQREAGEAFILSQKHMGWTLIPDQYDDGGYGGGNLDRPALQRLLQDIERGRIDCVVVYKVDRLSRSLLDFARLMERFERRSVSFVSVTQPFNTTTSLGRLILNVLLSFAQFEKDIIGERTRDKMSAARRKGKWVGGTPVLGYDVEGGRLVVNESEANQVREIFELYRRQASLEAVAEELGRRGWQTKSWRTRKGKQHAGRPFTNSSLRRLLTNVIYTGQVEHRGERYAGEQPAIVDRVLWEEVNGELCCSSRTEPKIARGQPNALLAGLLFCQSCKRPMIATYTAKGGRRYRYYVCQSVRQKGWQCCPTKSVSAGRIEASVVDQLRIALGVTERRERLGISEAKWERFEQGDTAGLVRAVAEQIGYDGTTGGVWLQLRGNEARL